MKKSAHIIQSSSVPLSCGRQLACVGERDSAAASAFEDRGSAIRTGVMRAFCDFGKYKIFGLRRVLRHAERRANKFRQGA